MKLKMGEIRGILLSVVVAILTCLMSVAGLTRLTLSGRVEELGEEIAINVILMLSSLVSNILQVTLNGRLIMSCVIHTLIVTGIILIASLLIDGEFTNGLLRITAVIVGSLISWAISLKMSNNRKFRKRRYR